ncbi:MAG: manganese efflux pump [Lachnospiraceae bacterium]|nr:manganese efflux pump [Lachnospiraceae bacterium]
MKKAQRLKIAGCFAFFQFLMPMIGWVCIHTIVKTFSVVQPFIPWTGFLLLLFLGGKMIIEGWKEDRENRAEDPENDTTDKKDRLYSEKSEITVHHDDEAGLDQSNNKVSNGLLFIQGIATSIDALSVGFAFATYTMLSAFSASCIIAVVTMIICLGGIAIGRKFGMLFAGKASIMGGIILIIIGVKLIL